MYTLRDALSSENLTALNTLKSGVTFVSNNIRLGVNNVDRLSVYDYSKWKTWTRTQRSNFKNCFAEADVNKAVIGYFLKFPANTGFLDEMNTWQDATSVGTIVAYSLTENNSITIDGQTVSVAKGQGIEFSLKNTHAVSASATESNWACLMLMK
jgi:hypothetical protein